MQIGQQPQTVQVPNYSGVNIQIFNPSVNAGNGTCPQTNPGTTIPPQVCYPQNYYTNNYAPTCPAQPAQPVTAQAPQVQQTENVKNVENIKNIENTKDTSTETKPKTEKREIVELTDDYLKSVENYLNNPNAQIRLQGAKEVAARIEEDKSRKDDLAMNALVNKMLQDPSTPVRFIALAELKSGNISGDDLTVKLLTDIQSKNTGYGEDALTASEILLKMSGNKVKKEFTVEVKKQTEKTDKKAK